MKDANCSTEYYTAVNTFLLMMLNTYLRVCVCVAVSLERLGTAGAL